MLGGGPAGIAAAAAAARVGAGVLLVERYGFLGGMGTAAGVTNFCGLHANVHGTIRQVVHGIADDLLERMRALDGLNEPHLIFGKIHAQAYDMSAFKCAADALLVEAGVDLLFHALAAGVARADDGRIETLFVETKSGRFAIRGRVFIDCSGDGEIAHRAGVPMEKGDDHGNLLYPTLMFRVGNVDAERAADAWRTIPQLMDAAEASGDFHFPRRGAIVRPQKHPYEWRVNVTQLRNPDGSATDGTDARSLSAGELEGRRQIVDYLRFLRARVPGFEARVRARHRAAARHPRDPAPHRRVPVARRGRADLRELRRRDRRQRLAAREACRRRRRMGLAADPRIARLQPAAVPDAAAAPRDRGAAPTTCWSPAAARR